MPADHIVLHGHGPCFRNRPYMRTLWLLAVFPIAAAVAACSSSASTSQSESFETEEDLAKSALKILGNQRFPGAKEMCSACHEVNQSTLKFWSELYKEGQANLNDPNKTAKQKVDGLRLDPNDPNAPFSPSKLGVAAASLHLSDMPETKKII